MIEGKVVKTDPQGNSSKIIIRQQISEDKLKAFKTGMYFSSKIICEIKASMKIGDNWQQDQLFKLTTEGFADIPISTINKIKYYKIKDSDKLLFKIETEKNRKFFRIDRLYSNDFFSKIAWSKLATLNLFPEVEDFKGEISGLMLKKSEILGNWQSRIVKITKQNGLQSSKSPTQQASLVVKQTSQIWTRFDVIEQQEYLVIKLFYGIIKLQFGIPLQNAVEWIQGFCSLLHHKNN